MRRPTEVIILFVLFILQNNVEGYSRIDPLVETKVGLIRGLRATDGAYSMFMGIPFGKVDEANLFGRSVSERIMALRLNSSCGFVTLIAAYAPTLKSSDESKDIFYNQLTDTVNTVSGGDRLYIPEDFNARVGRDHSAWPDCVGCYGIGNMNDNGQRLLEFCSEFMLYVTNTYFKGKLSHKVSWRHPRSGHWHQLDVILTRTKDLRDFLHIRTFHGADCDTDHSLVVAHAATPYPPFENVFEAYDDSAICPQVEEIDNTLVGTLDCLHLNIYVPQTASSKNRLPVLVWIYGGGFSIGFAGRTLYGPKYLVQHDVIVVTLNYRLGPYGFMCLDTPEVPGNQGLKDQLLALRWINQNIESFGGDKNQITIMGESAGGYSVDAHLISNHEKLYNRAILQSGTVLLPVLTREPDPTTPLKLAELLGFITNDVSEALRFLSKADPLLVIAVSTRLDRFLPCIEKEFENVEAFLTNQPYNLKYLKTKGMSILLGFNADEWISNHANQNPEYYSDYNELRNQLQHVFTFSENYLDEMESIVRRFYIGDEEINYDVRLDLANFDTDFKFIHPAERTIDSYLDSEADKVFYYMFSYVGGRNWVRRKNNVTIGGAAHADEIGYLFDISLWTEEPSSEDQLIIDRITKMWTNFVKYGDPTPDNTELLPVKWEPITSKDSPRLYMNIDSAMTMGKRPYHDRTAFWDMFYKMNEKYQKGYENNE